MKKIFTSLFAALTILFLLSFPIFNGISPRIVHAASYPPSATSRYLYVFPEGKMHVYDMNNNFSQVYSTSIPAAGIRGVVASPTTGMLYVSYGSNSNDPGSMLKYDLKANKVVWKKTYQFGVDSMAITPDGKKIYMPAGEESSSNLWYVIDASNGNVLTSIQSGNRPHNTIMSLNGQRVYLSAVGREYLEVADTATNRVSRYIGPLISGGRPFSINGTETLAYTAATEFLGFQVSSITESRVLYTVPVSGFNDGGAEVPSHGISLSPDEKEIYLIDGVNNYVHVFDVSKVPQSAPTKVASIKLTNKIIGSVTPNCTLDCDKVSWLLHSRDGRYVFVGDDGDVIDTSTRQIVKTIDTLVNTRQFVQIDWANGSPNSTTSRHGLGYVTTPQPAGTPTPTPSGPTPTPQTGQSVQSFTLINADTDQPISGFNPIPNNATINLATLPTKNINVRANTNPSTVGSVRFAFDSNANYGLENNPPYALASDEGGDYYAWTPSIGSHTISATPFSSANASGTQGQALTLSITVTNQASGPTPTPTLTPTPTTTPVTGQSVQSLTLINADTDQPIAGFETISNNATIKLSTLPTKNINIRANTNPSSVGSVRFGYDSNANYQTENYLPYAFASDDDGDYRPWTPTTGTHTITATPYTGQNAGGTAGNKTTITITVVN